MRSSWLLSSTHRLFNTKLSVYIFHHRILLSSPTYAICRYPQVVTSGPKHSYIRFVHYCSQFFILPQTTSSISHHFCFIYRHTNRFLHPFTRSARKVSLSRVFYAVVINSDVAFYVRERNIVGGGVCTPLIPCVPEFPEGGTCRKRRISFLLAFDS